MRTRNRIVLGIVLLLVVAGLILGITRSGLLGPKPKPERPLSEEEIKLLQEILKDLVEFTESTLPSQTFSSENK